MGIMVLCYLIVMLNFCVLCLFIIFCMNLHIRVMKYYNMFLSMLFWWVFLIYLEVKFLMNVYLFLPNVNSFSMFLLDLSFFLNNLKLKIFLLDDFFRSVYWYFLHYSWHPYIFPLEIPYDLLYDVLPSEKLVRGSFKKMFSKYGVKFIYKKKKNWLGVSFYNWLWYLLSSKGYWFQLYEHYCFLSCFFFFLMSSMFGKKVMVVDLSLIVKSKWMNMLAYYQDMENGLEMRKELNMFYLWFFFMFLYFLKVLSFFYKFVKNVCFSFSFNFFSKVNSILKKSKCLL